VEDGQAPNTQNPGSGIGLAVVKGIVDLHHGTVWAESKQGYGSAFIVKLPGTRSAYAETEIASKNAVKASGTRPKPDIASNELTIDTEGSGAAGNASYTVLLVEDNKELLQILAELFAPTCHVLVAHDGQEGLQMVREEMPDLVVSDIMMPLLSGTDLCNAIKSDLTTCHIPVVLLTALGATEQQMAGLKIGADDYISKPFDANLLLTRCNSIISNRRLLQKALQKSGTQEDAPLLAINAMDRKLLDDLHNIIEKNLDNADFKVNDIANELALSRTVFYAKFKSLTGLSPNDYIQSYKLKRAAEWLRKDPDMQIKDVTYRLGFNSPRYFSQCFKALFGITPAEYKKSGNDKT